MPRAFVIFCDDVRTEMTGKDIIIGVYQRTLFATPVEAGKPPVVQVRLYITIDDVEVNQDMECVVEMTLRHVARDDEDGLELANGTFRVRLDDAARREHTGSHRLVLAPPAVAFHLENEGRLAVEIHVNGAPCDVMGGIDTRIRTTPEPAGR